MLVTQIESRNRGGLYLAALLPAPMTLDDTVMPSNQVRFIALMTVSSASFTFMLVRWRHPPLRRLAKAAVNLGGTSTSRPNRGGCLEIVAATRAQHHAAAHFAASSTIGSALQLHLPRPSRPHHPAATGWVELLDDEADRQVQQGPDELELMVKGRW